MRREFHTKMVYQRNPGDHMDFIIPCFVSQGKTTRATTAMQPCSPAQQKDMFDLSHFIAPIHHSFLRCLKLPDGGVKQTLARLRRRKMTDLTRLKGESYTSLFCEILISFNYVYIYIYTHTHTQNKHV